ncbi:MAG: murein L,D-transpeptidase catalytic domain family protein [Bdellovibrionota bacterium]
MSMRKGLFLSLLVLSTGFAVSCAPAGPVSDEVCVDGACDEASLNAPIGEQPPQTPNFEDQLSSIPVERGNYGHVDPTKIVPAKALKTALDYFQKNFDKIKNKRWMSIADMSQHSGQRRLYLIDMTSGKVVRYLVSHGKGSDTNADGWATNFSNTNGSNATSVGFYFAAETYSGAHGLSMRLDGLSSTNSRARERAIVVHGASYVIERDNHAGKSLGCPAMDNGYVKAFIEKMKNGALYYITAG